MSVLSPDTYRDEAMLLVQGSSNGTQFVTLLLMDPLSLTFQSIDVERCSRDVIDIEDLPLYLSSSGNRLRYFFLWITRNSAILKPFYSTHLSRIFIFTCRGWAFQRISTSKWVYIISDSLKMLWIGVRLLSTCILQHCCCPICLVVAIWLSTISAIVLVRNAFSDFYKMLTLPYRLLMRLIDLNKSLFFPFFCWKAIIAR